MVEADSSLLNDPFTEDEVAQIMRSLPTGKAADIMGLTCELLRAPTALIEVNATNDSHGDPHAALRQAGDIVAFQPLLACVTLLLRRIVSSQSLPAALQVSKLVPVPKPGRSTGIADMNNYRGISVSCVLGRVLDRMLHGRLDAVVERSNLRALTQCGCRKDHGTLDAIFTLQHMINAARWSGRRLYVVFVDFKKAFDRVRRDLLVARCSQLGIHGPFLHALTLLYDKVQQQVCVS